MARTISKQFGILEGEPLEYRGGPLDGHVVQGWRSADISRKAIYRHRYIYALVRTQTGAAYRFVGEFDRPPDNALRAQE